MRAISLIVALFFLIAGCEEEPTEQDQGYGTIRIEVFDAPPPAEVERIDLTIREVSVHDTVIGWVTLAQPDTTFDFLQLVGGVTGVLAQDALAAGMYSQLRLILADSNSVTIGGQTYPLFVPSGTESGVKLNLHFSIDEGELVIIYVDFDAARSVKWQPEHGRYSMRPTFKAYKETLSGTLSGAVSDLDGAAVPNALLEAVAGADTSGTLTAADGTYRLVLLEGTYDLSASAEGYAAPDTTYTGVELGAGESLAGYDFVLSAQ